MKFKIHKPEPKQLAIRIIIALACLIVLMIIVYGVGIYKYHWNRYGTKKVIKVVPYPAAFVGPTWISISDFWFQKEFILHFYEKTGTPLENEVELDKQIVDRLIEEGLVDKYLRENKMIVTGDEIDKEYQNIITQNQGEENTKNMFSELYGISLPDFKKLIKQKQKISKFQNEVLVSGHLNIIIVKDEKRALDVLNELKTGADFTETAKKYSEDEISRDAGGDVGFINRGGVIFDAPMNKELEQGIFSLNVNEYPAAPFKTETGFLIFKVTEKKGTVDKSYTDWLAEVKNHTKIIRLIGK